MAAPRPGDAAAAPPKREVDASGRAAAPKSPLDAAGVEAGANENAGIDPAGVGDSPVPPADAPVAPNKPGDAPGVAANPPNAGVDAATAPSAALETADGAVEPNSPPATRGLHLSTFHLNLSRFRQSMKPPSVSHKSAHDKPKSGQVSAPACSGGLPGSECAHGRQRCGAETGGCGGRAESSYCCSETPWRRCWRPEHPPGGGRRRRTGSYTRLLFGLT